MTSVNSTSSGGSFPTEVTLIAQRRSKRAAHFELVRVFRPTHVARGFRLSHVEVRREPFCRKQLKIHLAAMLSRQNSRSDGFWRLVDEVELSGTCGHDRTRIPTPNTLAVLIRFW